MAFVAAVAGVVTVAMVLSGRTEQTAVAVPGPFGTNHAGLEQRRLAAGVPTMSEGNDSVHLHPTLELEIDGTPKTVPTGIGIGPDNEMAGLHTHENTGKIHVEGAEGATLGQFFAIWGVALSPTRVGPARGAVRMTVDGEPSTELGDLVLADGQEIRIAVASR